MIHHNQARQGFILPALIVFSLILMSSGLVVLQYVSSATGTVQTAYYNKLAKQAADAGAALAYSCIRDSNRTDIVPWVTNSRLTPASSYGCTGQPSSDSARYYSYQDTSQGVRAYFDVPTPATSNFTTSGTTVRSNGTVEFTYADGTVARRFEATTFVNIPNDLSASNVPIAQGKAVTQIAAGNSFYCSIANSELYCWGYNASGQLGLDECIVGLVCTGLYNNNITSPTRVNTKDITNKRVDSVTAGGLGACAIVEGRGECWGSNSNGQIGNNSTTFLEVFNTFFPFNPFDILYLGIDDLLAGQRYAPTYITGSLAGSNLSKIDFSGTVGLVPDRQSVCAISNGGLHCWGSNNYAVLGQPRYNASPAGSAGQVCAPIINWPCAPIPISPSSCDGWVTATQTIFIWTYITEYLCPAPLITPPSSFLTANNNAHQPVPVFGYGNRPLEATNSVFSGKRIVDVSVGSTGACAIADAGRTYCWGSLLSALGQANDDPKNGLTIHPNNTTALKGGPLASLKSTKLAVGSATGCTVANGKPYCWGRLKGDGVDNSSETPIAVPGIPAGSIINDINVTNEMAGFICTSGMGNAYCWGKRIPTNPADPNSATDILSPITISPGQIGLPTTKITAAGTGGSNSPTEGLLPGFFDSPASTCLITNATPYCGGNNVRGQLGTGNTVSVPGRYVRTGTAIGLTQGEAATAISSSENFNCALINAQPFCWGQNGATSGRLGVGDALDRTRPTAVIGLNNAYSTDISTGRSHVCSVTDGNIYCWGSNANGQLGTGGATTQFTPRLVTEGSISGSTMAATDVSAGANHTCAVINASAYCWGGNGSGQLGRGNTSSTNASVPQQVGGVLSGKMVTKITAGNNFTCAVADGLPYCWGENASGQLGRGTLGNSAATQSPALATNMPGTTTDIQAGDGFACAVEGGYTKCWGANNYGQLGRNSTTPSPTTATATPQLATTLNTRNTTSLSIGSNHACAIANGRGFCWGLRTNGRIGDSGATSGNAADPVQITEAAGATRLGEDNKPTAISAGSSTSCSIANAKIFCWGDNSYGQIGNTTTVSTSTPTVTSNYVRDVLQPAWDRTVFY